MLSVQREFEPGEQVRRSLHRLDIMTLDLEHSDTVEKSAHTHLSLHKQAHTGPSGPVDLAYAGEKKTTQKRHCLLFSEHPINISTRDIFQG